MSSVASTSRVTLGLLRQGASAPFWTSTARRGSYQAGVRNAWSTDRNRDFGGRRSFRSTRVTQSAWPSGMEPGSESQKEDKQASIRIASSGSALPAYHPPRSITVQDLEEMKARKEPIAMLTAYDYPSALAHRSAKVDITLIGDSLANVALGHSTTQQLDLDAMVHHCAAVSRGVNSPVLSHPSLPPTPLLIADLPFGIAHLPLEAAVPAALDVVRRGQLHGLKIEGGREVIPLISHLVSFGTPVMAHTGLKPQRAASASSLSLQARTAVEAIELLDEALALEESGAFGIIIECVPNRVAAEVTKRLRIPTIGIGAGKGTDGQVLVQDDMLGELNSPLSLLRILEAQHGHGQASETEPATQPQLPVSTEPTTPRFVRSFAKQATGTTAGAVRVAAVQEYVKAVKEGAFPTDNEGYKMKKEEWAQLKTWLEQFDQQEAAAAEQDRQAAAEVNV